MSDDDIRDNQILDLQDKVSELEKRENYHDLAIKLGALEMVNQARHIEIEEEIAELREKVKVYSETQLTSLDTQEKVIDKLNELKEETEFNAENIGKHRISIEKLWTSYGELKEAQKEHVILNGQSVNELRELLSDNHKQHGLHIEQHTKQLNEANGEIDILCNSLGRSNGSIYNLREVLRELNDRLIETLSGEIEDQSLEWFIKESNKVLEKLDSQGKTEKKECDHLHFTARRDLSWLCLDCGYDSLDSGGEKTDGNVHGSCVGESVHTPSVATDSKPPEPKCRKCGKGYDLYPTDFKPALGLCLNCKVTYKPKEDRLPGGTGVEPREDLYTCRLCGNEITLVEHEVSKLTVEVQREDLEETCDRLEEYFAYLNTLKNDSGVLLKRNKVLKVMSKLSKLLLKGERLSDATDGGLRD